MSDDDMSDEDYGFEYSDEDEEEADVGVENQYYNSKALLDTDPRDAISGLEEVISLEEEKGEWGFKALKQMVKLYFSQGNLEKMMVKYTELLSYIKSAVTRNYSEKSINKLLDLVSTSDKTDFLHMFYETTLEALMNAQNERLWFKTNLKLGKLWCSRSEYGRLTKILKELRKSCQTADGEDDMKKGTQLLEIYALEIQMYTATKNSKKLKALYQRSLQIKSAIPHPRIMGIIRECGGKMHMQEREWDNAHTDFFEAFKNYDECGSPRRIACLKYLVLANMLMMSEINPFDSPEAKPYKNDPEILAMTRLVNAYQRNEIKEFVAILVQNKATIMEDEFIRNYIEELLKNVRTQVLLQLIKPYTRIKLSFISEELDIPTDDVEQLLVGLILDNKVSGQIDQVNSILELGVGSGKETKQYKALEGWTKQLRGLEKVVLDRNFT